MEISDLYNYVIESVKKLKLCLTIPELRGTLTGIIFPLGFQQFAYNFWNEEGLLKEVSIDTSSEEWRKIYITKKYYEIDPVVLKAIREPGAFFWSCADYGKHSKAVRELFMQAEEFGVYRGVTTPLKTTAKAHAILTCSSALTAQQPKNLTKRQIIVCCRLLAEIFHQCALTIRQKTKYHLKPREVEILKLSALGMSGSDIATMTGLSSIYIAEISRNIMQKFGTRNKLAAIYRAIELDAIRFE